MISVQRVYVYVHVRTCITRARFDREFHIYFFNQEVHRLSYSATPALDRSNKLLSMVLAPKQLKPGLHRIPFCMPAAFAFVGFSLRHHLLVGAQHNIQSPYMEKSADW